MSLPLLSATAETARRGASAADFGIQLHGVARLEEGLDAAVASAGSSPPAASARRRLSRRRALM